MHDSVFRFLTAPLVLFYLFVLPACQAPSPPVIEDSNIVSDDLGEAHTLPTSTQRIIPLAPSLTEILFLIEAGDRVAGVSQSDNYPPEVEQLPRFSSWPLNVESILALEPDLILATTQVNDPEETARFVDLGIPVLYFDFSTFEDVMRVSDSLVSWLDLPEGAFSPAAALTLKLDRLKESTSILTNKPNVLFLVGDDPLYAFGAESYIHSIIESAGGKSVTASIELAAPILSEEYVLEQNPDMILGTFGDVYDAADLLAKHPAWKDVKAVQTGAVHTIPADFVLRPGPRLVEGAYAMAQVLHPNLVIQP